MENKCSHEIFYSELQSLIKDFSKKRKEYNTKYKAIKLIALLFTNIAVLFLGLSFIEKYSFVFKIIAIVFSTMATFVLSLDKVVDFKELWSQRTITLVKMLELKRIYRIEVLPKIDDVDFVNDKIAELTKSLNIIMTEDINLWQNNVKDFGNIKNN